MTRPPSHLRGIVRLAAQTLARRGGGGGLKSAAGPGRPLAPGRRLAVESGEMRLDQRSIVRFISATGGERIGAYSDGYVLPPTYGATWETAMVLELLAAGETGLPRRGLIHLGSELLQIRILRRDDVVRSRLELERTEATPGGMVLTLMSRSWNGAGQLATEGRTSLLLRGRSGAGGVKTRRPSAETASDGEWLEVTRWDLRGGHGRRYARASGDYNPIHLWPITARPFGFARPIVQGFCIQSLVANAFIERNGGDPAKLRRLRITFRAPLPLPSRPRLLLNGDGEGARLFKVASDDETPRVFAHGEVLCGR
jgi:acyl dehydratase